MSESKSKSLDYTGTTCTPWESPFQSRNVTMTDLPSTIEAYERRGSDGTLFDPISESQAKDKILFDEIEEEIKAHEDLVRSKQSDNDEKTDKTEKLQDEEPSHGRLLPLPRFIIVYGCLGLSMFLTSLDQTIVACILPNISSEFGAKNAPWVGIAFLLLQTTFSPCYGRMSDVFGRKPLLIAALAIFLLGTGICGGAPSIEVLIVARAIAGIGGAGLLSMVHICISDIVTLRKRGIYHGMISAVNGTGSVLGPLVGGIFASRPNLGWRWAFYFQLPIIAFAGIATWIALPKLGNYDKRLLGEKLRTIDYMGSFLFVGGTTLTLLGLLFISPPEVQFGSALVAAPFFVGLAMLAFFAVWEIKFAFQPIVPFHIFRILAIDQIYILNFVFGYVFYAVLYYLPEFYQVVAGQDAVQASLSLMPVVVTSIALSWFTGLMTTFMGRYKWSIVLGLLLQLAASVCLYVLFVPGIRDGIAIAIMIVMGFGFGCQMQTNLVGVQSATHQKMVAVATSVRNFSRNIGGVLGIAFSGIIIHVRFPASLERELPPNISGQAKSAVDDPLSIRHLSEKIGGDADKVVELYARVLRETFLVYIPLGAIALLIAIFLHEYSLQRGKNGEPIRMIGMQTVAYRYIKGRFTKRREQPRRGSEESNATTIA